MEDEEYVVTIMDRHYIGEDNFIYSVNHAEVGTLDKTTSIFTARDGKKYAPMTNMGTRRSKRAFCYANIITLSELEKSIDDALNTEEKIDEFEYRFRSQVFCSTMTDDKKPIFFDINIDEIKYKSQEILSESQATKDSSSDTSKFLIDYQQGELLSGEDLLSNILSGKYSLSELKQLREDLIAEAEDLQGTIDSIDLQIEASENNTASISLKTDLEEDICEEEQREPGPLIDTEDLFNKITKTLIAQDKSLRRVLVEIARKEENSKKKRDGILLTGSTGIGKTEMMRLIAKYINRPFIQIPATSLTSAGYVGKDIEEVLWDVYVKCNYDRKKTENAIVCFEEIDKKGSTKKDDPSGQAVLNTLLQFIEGAEYDACENVKSSTEKVKINTSNMTVFFTGSFNDVYSALNEDKQMGFNKDIELKYRKAQPIDFVEKGLMTKEFMGRVAVIKLDDHDVNNLIRIMLESDESAIKIQEQIFAKCGVKITFTNKYLTAVATDAVERKTGARGLNTVIDETTWEAFEAIYKKENYGKYSEVIIDEETFKDSSKFQLIKK